MTNSLSRNVSGGLRDRFFSIRVINKRSHPHFIQKAIASLPSQLSKSAIVLCSVQGAIAFHSTTVSNTFDRFHRLALPHPLSDF